MSAGEPTPSVDPRRELWRRGSYEIVGDWLAPASLSVLDAVERTVAGDLAGRRLLDVAAGTGTVSIEAARRGATVVGVDLTPELLEVARRRSAEADVEVRFEAGDFDQLDAVLGDDGFDIVTSAFGVIFSPQPDSTLSALADRLAPGGVIGVSSWDPDGSLMVPDEMLDLFPEKPAMLDMGRWSTGLADLAASAGVEVVAAEVDELVIPFRSVDAAAEQLERWSGGWAQLLDRFDELGVGREARTRFVDHLASFSTRTDDGIGLRARFHVGVLARPEAVDG